MIHFAARRIAEQSAQPASVAERDISLPPTYGVGGRARRNSPEPGRNGLPRERQRGFRIPGRHIHRIRANSRRFRQVEQAPEEEAPPCKDHATRLRKSFRAAGAFRSGSVMEKHRIYTTSFASVYPHYVAKAEKKGRTKGDVDGIIRWLTGYSQAELDALLEDETDFETFFSDAPRMNPSREMIKGVVCGVRVEDVEEPTMREIRYLDKLIDELAKGKAMEKILRAE